MLLIGGTIIMSLIGVNNLTENRELVTANDFGALIKERRRALSMSQTALAKKLGASRRWVTDIESGKETAELGRVIKALKILGVHLTAKPVQEIKAAPVSVSPELKTAKLLAHRDKVGLPPSGVKKAVNGVLGLYRFLQASPDASGKFPEQYKFLQEQLDPTGKLSESYRSIQEQLNPASKLLENYKALQKQSKLND